MSTSKYTRPVTICAHYDAHPEDLQCLNVHCVTCDSGIQEILMGGDNNLLAQSRAQCVASSSLLSNRLQHTPTYFRVR